MWFHVIRSLRRRPALISRCTFQAPAAALGSACRNLCDSSPRARPPLILLLDIDETLLRPKIPSAREHANRKLVNVDFEVTINIKDGVPCLVSLRPGLADFFSWIRERRTQGLIEGPWIFAQGVEPYVDALLPKLDPDGDLFATRVLSHQSCTPTKAGGYVMKDLLHVPCDASGGDSAIPRMILVDNNSISAVLYPQNVLLVRDWRSDSEEDNELARVSATIDAILEDTEGDPGDYATRLAKMTPGHAYFRKQLPALRSLLDGRLRDGEKLDKRLNQTWARACKMKQELLGLAVGEY